MKAMNLWLPFTPVGARWLRWMLWVQVALAVGRWALGGSRSLPGPVDVARAWWDLVQRQGLLFELWSSVKVSLVSLLVSTAAAVAVAGLSTAPVFMPLAKLSAAMRFLGFAGLTYVFMLASSDAHWLRVSILSFGMFVFMVTGLLAEIAATPRSQIDHCRTLGMQHWRITGEMVLMGKADVILDLMRQNAAVGWTLLTLVEGMTRSQGGIGALLLNQNRYFLLAGVFAIQLTILTYGLGQDSLLSLLKDSLCPYSRLGKEGNGA